MTPADVLILRVFHELHGDPEWDGEPSWGDAESFGHSCREVSVRCGVPASRVWEALHRQEAAS